MFLFQSKMLKATICLVKSLGNSLSRIGTERQSRSARADIVQATRRAPHERPVEVSRIQNMLGFIRTAEIANDHPLSDHARVWSRRVYIRS